MEKYWQQERRFHHGRFTKIMNWYIEYEEGYYLCVSKTRGRLPGEPTAVIRRIERLKLGGDSRLIEVPKETVMRALKSVVEELDLPREINTLTHKF